MIQRSLFILLACIAIHAAEDIPVATAFIDEAATLTRGLVDPQQRVQAFPDIIRLRVALSARADAEAALAELVAADADISNGSRSFGSMVVAQETQRVLGVAAALPIAQRVEPICRNMTISIITRRGMEAGADPIASLLDACIAVGRPADLSDVFVLAIGMVAKRGDKAAMDKLADVTMYYVGRTHDSVESVVEIAIALAQAGQTEAAATVMRQAQIATQHYMPELRDHAIRGVADGWGGIGDLKQAIVTAKTMTDAKMSDDAIRSAFGELLRVQGPEKAIEALSLMPISADRPALIGSIAWDAVRHDQIHLAETLLAQVEQPAARFDAQTGLLTAYAKAGATGKATAAASSAVSSAFMTADHLRRGQMLVGVVKRCVEYGIPVPKRDRIIADLVAWPGREAMLRMYAAYEAAEALWLLGAEAEAKTAAAGYAEESQPVDFAVLHLHGAKRPVSASLLTALGDAATRSSPSAAAHALGTIAWVKAETGDLAGSLATAADITDPDCRKTAIARVARTMAANGDVAAVRKLLADAAIDSVGLRIAVLVAAAEELLPKAAITK